MPLTDRAVLNLKANGKQHKHFDGGGLHLVVYPTGGKCWRLSYRYAGKENTLSFGSYPAVSLKIAREKREEAKALLAQGIDPGKQKQEEKAAAAEIVLNTFELIAREWHGKFEERWTEKNAKVILARMQRDIFPHIGNIPIRELKSPQILDVANRIAERGALDYAHRALQYCGMIFRYAIATGKSEHNIVADLRGALPTARVKHHATITDPQKIGRLLRAIDGYDGYFPVTCALKLAPLVFVRPGELRCAAWDEFDFSKAEWRIPAERMKIDLPPWNESSCFDSMGLFFGGQRWARSVLRRSRLLGSFVKSRFWSVRGTPYPLRASRRVSARRPITAGGANTAG